MSTREFFILEDGKIKLLGTGGDCAELQNLSQEATLQSVLSELQSIDAGAASEVTLQAILTALGPVATETTLATLGTEVTLQAVVTALGPLASETTLGQLLTKQEEIRVLLDSIDTNLDTIAANQLPDGHNVSVDNFPASQTVDDGGGSITVDGTVAVTGTQQDALTDAELRATPVKVDDDETQARLGEVSATPTANTVQDRLKNIYEELVPDDGLDPTNSSQANLGAGGTFVGQYRNTKGFSSALAFAFSDVQLDTVELQWSVDGINPRPGLISASELTETFTNGFYVYIATLTTMVDEYVRFEVTNGATPTGIFEADLWFYDDGFAGSFGSLDSTLSTLSTALLTRSVGAGVNPDDTFTNIRTSGRHTPNSTTTPLGGSEVYRGTWFEWQGNYVSMITDLKSDQRGQFYIDFSEDETPTDGDDTSVDDSILTIYDPNETAILRRITPVQSRWVRIRYINDSIAQSIFVLDTAFTVNAPPLVTQRMAENVADNNLAGLVKAGITAPDDAREYRIINRTGNSLNTAVTDFTPEIRNNPNNKIQTFSINVTSTAVSQLPVPVGFSRVRGVEFTNTQSAEDGDSVFYRDLPSGILNNGNIILPSSTKEKHYGNHSGQDVNTIPPIYLQASGTSSQNTLNIDADTEDSNTGVTPVNAMFANDTNRAIFDATSDSVTISGFDGTGLITEANIISVKIKMLARKESGALGETTTFQSAGAADADSSTSVSTPTITRVAGGTYYVAFARRNINAAIASVTNTMGFTGSTLIQDLSNGNESRISVYKMTGTPTSDGVVTANFSAATDHEVAGYIVLTNVQGEGAVDTDAAASGLTPGGTVSATQNGMVLQFIATEQTDVLTLDAGFTERAEAGSTTNNDQVLNIATKPVSVTGSENWGATLSGVGDYTGIAIPLNPSDAANPIVIVSHSEGSTELDQVVASETDAVYEQDITNDAAWTPSLIDGTTLTISPSFLGNADLEVNRLWLEVTEAGASVVVTGEWIGDSV